MNVAYRIFRACLALGLGLILLWLAAALPAHPRGIAPAVLASAGQGTRQAHELARYYLDSGLPGPAVLLWEGGGTESTPREELRFAQLRRDHPAFAITGGRAPYFEQFLQLPGVKAREAATVLEAVIPPRHRQALREYLAGSAHLGVGELLATRDLTGWTRLLPANTPAGGPLEASVLIAALLVQGDYLPPEFETQLLLTARRALNGSAREVRQLEDALLALLSMARPLTWRQLTEVLAAVDTIPQLVGLAESFDRVGKAAPIAAAILLLEAAPPVVNYLREYADGDEALALAVQHGRGALELLTEAFRPVHQPSAFELLLRRHARIAEYEPYLAPLVVQQPSVSLGLRFVLLLASGGLISAVILMPLGDRVPLAVRLGGAFVLGLALLGGLETELLTPAERPTPQLRFDLSAITEGAQPAKLAAAMFDPTTWYVLGGFFVVQLVIYVLGLSKLGEIRRREITPEMKLKLLDNEENLFDLGLYLGLGGTVASLILLALNIVQASLITAYASTLFGILFAALLKIAHVRRYRRKLLLEAHEQELRKERARPLDFSAPLAPEEPQP